MFFTQVSNRIIKLYYDKLTILNRGIVDYNKLGVFTQELNKKLYHDNW